MGEQCLGCGRKIGCGQSRTYFAGNAFHDSVCAFEWFSRCKMGRLTVPEKRLDELLALMTDFLTEQGLSYEWFEYFRTYWR